MLPAAIAMHQHFVLGRPADPPDQVEAVGDQVETGFVAIRPAVMGQGRDQVGGVGLVTVPARDDKPDQADFARGAEALVRQLDAVRLDAPAQRVAKRQRAGSPTLVIRTWRRLHPAGFLEPPFAHRHPLHFDDRRP